MLQTTADMDGDCMTWEISPNTTIGTVTSNITIGDSIINVSQTVVDNIDAGFKCRIADATSPTVTYEDVGQVLNVDKENSQITIENTASMAWTAASGVIIQMTVSFADEMEIGSTPTTFEIGKSTIGASYLPANTPVICSYDNKSLLNTKKLHVYFEMFY